MRETRELLDAPQLDLAAEILASGGMVRLRVRGGSMLPSLWPGDVLTIEGTSCDSVASGDIVLVRRNFVHRVREKHDYQGRLCLITRGDAVRQTDPPVEASELLGRIAFIQRNRRVIVPRRRLSTATRSFAWMLCHGDRFRSICLRLHFWWQKVHQQIGEEIVECPTSTL